VIYTLYKATYDPIALDISFNSLKLINSSKRVQGEASILPFPPNSFDLVLAFESLEHIPNSTFSSVLDEISKVARKYIIITVPFRERLEWNYARSPACGCIFNGAYHALSFGDDELKYLFNGFKCIDLRKIVNVLHPDRTISL
jgi:ubiquinone/menaquinone biosynthesis C-methylase UbiE